MNVSVRFRPGLVFTGSILAGRVMRLVYGLFLILNVGLHCNSYVLFPACTIWYIGRVMKWLF